MRADWIRLMVAAARLPLRSDPAKSQFDLPSAHGADLILHGIVIDGHSTIVQVPTLQ
jgi:hypothetical protein